MSRHIPLVLGRQRERPARATCGEPVWDHGERKERMKACLSTQPLGRWELRDAFHQTQPHFKGLWSEGYGKMTDSLRGLMECEHSWPSIQGSEVTPGAACIKRRGHPSNIGGVFSLIKKGIFGKINIYLSGPVQHGPGRAGPRQNQSTKLPQRRFCGKGPG